MNEAGNTLLEEARKEIKYRVLGGYHVVNIKLAAAVLDALENTEGKLNAALADKTHSVNDAAIVSGSLRDKIATYEKFWAEIIQFVKDAPEEKIREWTTISGRKSR